MLYLVGVGVNCIAKLGIWLKSFLRCFLDSQSGFEVFFKIAKILTCYCESSLLLPDNFLEIIIVPCCCVAGYDPNEALFETAVNQIQGRHFGIALLTSKSRNMPPATSPSWTQPSASHQSS